jgi:hypothetical protein
VLAGARLLQLGARFHPCSHVSSEFAAGWGWQAKLLRDDCAATDDADPASRHELLADCTHISLVPSYLWAKIIAQRNPSVEWALQWNDELFFGGLLLLESHYLKHYGNTSSSFIVPRLMTDADGSFSENFYGLKRVLALNPLTPPPVPATSTAAAIFSSVAASRIKVPRSGKVLSLVFLVSEAVNLPSDTF